MPLYGYCIMCPKIYGKVQRWRVSELLALVRKPNMGGLYRTNEIPKHHETEITRPNREEVSDHCRWRCGKNL